jgi:hypothetical protein
MRYPSEIVVSVIFVTGLLFWVVGLFGRSQWAGWVFMLGVGVSLLGLLLALIDLILTPIEITGWRI